MLARIQFPTSKNPTDLLAKLPLTDRPDFVEYVKFYLLHISRDSWKNRLALVVKSLNIIQL